MDSSRKSTPLEVASAAAEPDADAVGGALLMSLEMLRMSSMSPFILSYPILNTSHCITIDDEKYGPKVA